MYVEFKRTIVGTEITRVVAILHSEKAIEVDTSKYSEPQVREKALMTAQSTLERTILDEVKRSFKLVSAPVPSEVEIVPEEKKEVPSKVEIASDKKEEVPAEKITPIPKPVTDKPST